MFRLIRYTWFRNKFHLTAVGAATVSYIFYEFDRYFWKSKFRRSKLFYIWIKCTFYTQCTLQRERGREVYYTRWHPWMFFFFEKKLPLIRIGWILNFRTISSCFQTNQAQFLALASTVRNTMVYYASYHMELWLNFLNFRFGSKQRNLERVE